MFVCTASRSKFYPIMALIMRALLAILCLLLCVTTVRADKLPVIKDLKAIEYVGKKVEVHGLVSLSP